MNGSPCWKKWTWRKHFPPSAPLIFTINIFGKCFTIHFHDINLYPTLSKKGASPSGAGSCCAVRFAHAVHMEFAGDVQLSAAAYKRHIQLYDRDMSTNKPLSGRFSHSFTTQLPISSHVHGCDETCFSKCIFHVNIAVFLVTRSFPSKQW